MVLTAARFVGCITFRLQWHVVDRVPAHGPNLDLGHDPYPCLVHDTHPRYHRPCGGLGRDPRHHDGCDGGDLDPRGLHTRPLRRH